MSLMKGLIPWSRNDSLARNDEERNPFLSLQNEMNRMFDGFFRGFGLQPFAGFEGGFGGLGGLRSEEDEQEYRLTAEMPGIGEKDLEVKLSGDTLTIRAQKEEAQEDEKRSFKQRSSRSFFQSLTVPAGVDRDEIRAELKNGVLKLTLPKTEEARRSTRTIDINTD